MSGDIKPKRGRPSTGNQDVRVWITPNQAALARLLGKGNVSAGVRAALDAVAELQTKKDIS